MVNLKAFGSTTLEIKTTKFFSDIGKYFGNVCNINPEMYFV